VVDEVVLSKVAVIERYLARIREEYHGDPARLEHLTVEDSIVLNLQRACEASIDIAMRLVSRGRLGLPQDSRAAFELLRTTALLTDSLADRMKRMVGFRNVAVHDYTQLSRGILIAILDERLADFEEFCRAAVSAL
jgi:uncharacterized protein YutE (UPF0331/DUF86 family)